MRMRVWAASPLRGSSKKNCKSTEEGQGQPSLQGGKRSLQGGETIAMEHPLERVMQVAVGQVDASMAVARGSLAGCRAAWCCAVSLEGRAEQHTGPSTGSPLHQVRFCRQPRSPSHSRLSSTHGARVAQRLAVCTLPCAAALAAACAAVSGCPRHSAGGVTTSCRCRCRRCLLLPVGRHLCLVVLLNGVHSTHQLLHWHLCIEGHLWWDGCRCGCAACATLLLLRRLLLPGSQQRIGAQLRAHGVVLQGGNSSRHYEQSAGLWCGVAGRP